MFVTAQACISAAGDEAVIRKQSDARSAVYPDRLDADAATVLSLSQ